jgi:hypothetical protein
LYRNSAFNYGVTKRYLSGLDISRSSGKLSKKEFVQAVLALFGKLSMVVSLLKLSINKCIQKHSAKVAYKKYIKKEWNYVNKKYGLLKSGR